jgi:hypothetical protein
MTDFDPPLEFIRNDSAIPPHQIPSCPFPSIVFPLIYFENWLWGLMIKSKSSTYLLNNDIFENKCGGIRVGINYSASVLIDGNTIRDHTGPGVYAINFDKQSTKENTTHLWNSFEMILLSLHTKYLLVHFPQ